MTIEHNSNDKPRIQNEVSTPNISTPTLRASISSSSLNTVTYSPGSQYTDITAVNTPSQSTPVHPSDIHNDEPQFENHQNRVNVLPEFIDSSSQSVNTTSSHISAHFPNEPLFPSTYYTHADQLSQAQSSQVQSLRGTTASSIGGFGSETGSYSNVSLPQALNPYSQYFPSAQVAGSVTSNASITPSNVTDSLNPILSILNPSAVISNDREDFIDNAYQLNQLHHYEAPETHNFFHTSSHSHSTRHTREKSNILLNDHMSNEAISITSCHNYTDLESKVSSTNDTSLKTIPDLQSTNQKDEYNNIVQSRHRAHSYVAAHQFGLLDPRNSIDATSNTMSLSTKDSNSKITNYRYNPLVAEFEMGPLDSVNTIENIDNFGHVLDVQSHSLLHPFGSSISSNDGINTVNEVDIVKINRMGMSLSNLQEMNDINILGHLQPSSSVPSNISSSETNTHIGSIGMIDNVDDTKNNPKSNERFNAINSICQTANTSNSYVASTTNVPNDQPHLNENVERNVVGVHVSTPAETLLVAQKRHELQRSSVIYSSAPNPVAIEVNSAPTVLNSHHSNIPLNYPAYNGFPPMNPMNPMGPQQNYQMPSYPPHGVPLNPYTYKPMIFPMHSSAGLAGNGIDHELYGTIPSHFQNNPYNHTHTQYAMSSSYPLQNTNTSSTNENSTSTDSNTDTSSSNQMTAGDSNKSGHSPRANNSPSNNSPANNNASSIPPAFPNSTLSYSAFSSTLAAMANQQQQQGISNQDRNVTQSNQNNDFTNQNHHDNSDSNENTQSKDNKNVILHGSSGVNQDVSVLSSKNKTKDRKNDGDVSENSDNSDNAIDDVKNSLNVSADTLLSLAPRRTGRHSNNNTSSTSNGSDNDTTQVQSTTVKGRKGDKNKGDNNNGQHQLASAALPYSAPFSSSTHNNNPNNSLSGVSNLFSTFDVQQLTGANNEVINSMDINAQLQHYATTAPVSSGAGELSGNRTSIIPLATTSAPTTNHITDQLTTLLQEESAGKKIFQVNFDDCTIDVPFESTDKVLADYLLKQAEKEKEKEKRKSESIKRKDRNDGDDSTAEGLTNSELVLASHSASLKGKKRGNKSVEEANPSGVGSNKKSKSTEKATKKKGKNAKLEAATTSALDDDNDDDSDNQEEPQSMFILLATKQAAELTPIPADIDAEGDVELKRERNKNSAAQYRRRRKLYLDLLEKRVCDMEKTLVKKSLEMDLLRAKEEQLKVQLHDIEDQKQSLMTSNPSAGMNLNNPNAINLGAANPAHAMMHPNLYHTYANQHLFNHQNGNHALQHVLQHSSHNPAVNSQAQVQLPNHLHPHGVHPSMLHPHGTTYPLPHLLGHHVNTANAPNVPSATTLSPSQTSRNFAYGHAQHAGNNPNIGKLGELGANAGVNHYNHLQGQAQSQPQFPTPSAATASISSVSGTLSHMNPQYANAPQFDANGVEFPHYHAYANSHAIPSSHLFTHHMQHPQPQPQGQNHPHSSTQYQRTNSHSNPAPQPVNALAYAHGQAHTMPHQQQGNVLSHASSTNVNGVIVDTSVSRVNSSNSVISHVGKPGSISAPHSSMKPVAVDISSHVSSGSGSVTSLVASSQDALQNQGQSKGVRLGAFFALLSCVIFSIFMPVPTYTSSYLTPNVSQNVYSQHNQAFTSGVHISNADNSVMYKNNVNDANITTNSHNIVHNHKQAHGNMFNKHQDVKTTRQSRTNAPLMSRRLFEATGYKNSFDFDQELLQLFGLSKEDFPQHQFTYVHQLENIEVGNYVKDDIRVHDNVENAEDVKAATSGTAFSSDFIHPMSISNQMFWKLSTQSILPIYNYYKTLYIGNFNYVKTFTFNMIQLFGLESFFAQDTLENWVSSPTDLDIGTSTIESESITLENGMKDMEYLTNSSWYELLSKFIAICFVSTIAFGVRFVFYLSIGQVCLGFAALFLVYLIVQDFKKTTMNITKLDPSAGVSAEIVATSYASPSLIVPSDPIKNTRVQNMISNVAVLENLLSQEKLSRSDQDINYSKKISNTTTSLLHQHIGQIISYERESDLEESEEIESDDSETSNTSVTEETEETEETESDDTESDDTESEAEAEAEMEQLGEHQSREAILKILPLDIYSKLTRIKNATSLSQSHVVQENHVVIKLCGELFYCPKSHIQIVKLIILQDRERKRLQTQEQPIE